MKIPIADSLFIGHQRAAFLGGENGDVAPDHFSWQSAPFFESSLRARFVTDSEIKWTSPLDSTKTVAWLLEPFLLHPENYWEAARKPFRAVLTSNRWFADNFAYRGWRWVPHGGSWIAPEHWGIKPKTKKVSMLMSEKDTMPGHRLRHEIARRFGDRIDVLGTGGPDGKYIPAIDAYAPYEFSIIVENERTPGYFTEKLIDCLSQGTVPIYWGAPDITNFFRHFPLAVIPKDADEAGEIVLNILNRDIRWQYFDIHQAMSGARKWTCTENWIFDNYSDLFEEE